MTNFNAKKFVEEKLQELKKVFLKNERAVCATSGGVDSTTCAVLVHQVLGENLKVVFIDDGLMREGEAQMVYNILQPLGINLTIIERARDFFKNLKGLLEPEEKRKAFRQTFYEILGEIVKNYKARYLIQGTIAADILETKKGIKTQHNVLEQIGLSPQRFGLEVIEPLKELFKPQVRQVARFLGLPPSIYNRMPFPGPGLATRILGEITPQRVEIVRKATEIVEEELRDVKKFQAFAVLFSDKATGLSEGRRLLGDIIAVRCVDSKDALRAKPSDIPFIKLRRIQQRITSEIPSVVKVLYDLTPKPPSTIEYI